MSTLKNSLLIVLIGFSTLLLSACAQNVCQNPFSPNCIKIRQANIKKLKKNSVVVLTSRAGARIIIPSDGLFVTNGHRMQKDDYKIIVPLANVIKTYPGAKIYIKAYSDNILQKHLRDKLTYQQAKQVAGCLWIQNVPMRGQTIRFKGKGDIKPIANTRSIMGMAYNRRVEVIVKLKCGKCKFGDNHRSPI